MKISVVVPTHARPERLYRLLEALRAQQFPMHEFEVLVVDDGSPMHARPEENKFCGNQSLLRQKNQGPAAARNHGSRVASGELLAFTDDDCIPEPQWLNALWHAYQQMPSALLGGLTLNGLPNNLFSTAAESLLQFFDEDELARGQALTMFASNNLACDRKMLISLGGFDEGYFLAAGEDRAFCRSWTDAGWPLLRVAEARLLHFHDHTLQSFWRQQKNYGRGAAVFHKQGNVTSTVPREKSFYARLLLHPLQRKQWSLIKRVKVMFAVALSQLAITAGVFHDRRSGS